MLAMETELSTRPVIVVDDSADDLALTTRLLRKVVAVSRMLTFDSGEAVVEFLREVKPGSPDFPAALIIDVKMVGMSGLELLEWVRARPAFNAVPVVIWSSSHHPQDIERAAALRAQCYIGKYPPVDTVSEMFDAIVSYRGLDAGDMTFAIRGNALGRGSRSANPAPTTSVG